MIETSFQEKCIRIEEKSNKLINDFNVIIKNTNDGFIYKSYDEID